MGQIITDYKHPLFLPYGVSTRVRRSAPGVLADSAPADVRRMRLGQEFRVSGKNRVQKHTAEALGGS